MASSCLRPADPPAPPCTQFDGVRHQRNRPHELPEAPARVIQVVASAQQSVYRFGHGLIPLYVHAKLLFVSQPWQLAARYRALKAATDPLLQSSFSQTAATSMCLSKQDLNYPLSQHYLSSTPHSTTSSIHRQHHHLRSINNTEQPIAAVPTRLQIRA